MNKSYPSREKKLKVFPIMSVHDDDVILDSVNHVVDVAPAALNVMFPTGTPFSNNTNFTYRHIIDT